MKLVIAKKSIRASSITGDDVLKIFKELYNEEWDEPGKYEEFFNRIIDAIGLDPDEDADLGWEIQDYVYKALPDSYIKPLAEEDEVSVEEYKDSLGDDGYELFSVMGELANINSNEAIKYMCDKIAYFLNHRS